MIGLAAVRKAVKKGYKRYGVPGAVVAGLGTLIGLRFVKRKLAGGKSSQNQSDESGGQSDTAN